MSHWIKADTTFLSTTEGGRRHPVDLSENGYYYRPHLVVGDPTQRKAILRDGVGVESYVGVQLRPCNMAIAPGESAVVELELAYYPAAGYRGLVSEPLFPLE